jgi:hypothetical protein
LSDGGFVDLARGELLFFTAALLLFFMAAPQYGRMASRKTATRHVSITAVIKTSISIIPNAAPAGDGGRRRAHLSAGESVAMAARSPGRRSGGSGPRAAQFNLDEVQRKWLLVRELG